MSDGNYNRSLLPHTPYQSGMKTGKAMAKMKAVEAFKEYLNIKSKINPISDEESSSKTIEEIELFKKILEQKIQCPKNSMPQKIQ